MSKHNAMIDELVRQAEAIVLEYFQGSESSKDTIGNTQLSNAIDVIVQSKSVEVFCNWLRYQMAREARESSDQKRFWTTPKGSQRTFGKRVIDEVRRPPCASNVENITHFLGFLRRAYIAREYLKQKEESQ
jgi:uncharacterized protein (DUF2147 family)